MLPEEMRMIFICDHLHLSYDELVRQPAWWVNNYIIYLEGKAKAENQKLKGTKRK